MNRKNILRQLAVTFLITWSAWLSMEKVESPTSATLLFILGGWGPTIAGLAEYYRRKTLKQAFKGGNLRLFVPLFLGTLALGLFAAVGKKLPLKSPLEYAGIFFVMSFLKGGNEEVLWRGTLAEDVKALSFRKQSMFIGGVWALWHLPLYLLPAQGRGGLLFFIPFAVSCFFMHALLYQLRRKGNLWHPILYHGLLNLVMTEFLAP